MNEVEYEAVEVEGEYHVIPCDDYILHTPSFTCDCVPIAVKKEKVAREGAFQVMVWEHRFLRAKENQQ